MEELVKRLRDWPRICAQYDGSVDQLHDEAADAIEELQADKTALNGTVTNLLEQIKDLGKPKWIPVTERLPVVGDKVIVAIRDESGDTRYDYTNTGWFSGNGEKWVVEDEYCSWVTHWMPLPEPPKEET